MGKLWATAQLLSIQHFLLGGATLIAVGRVVCKS